MLAATAFAATAQDKDWRSQSYEEFRQGIKDRHKEFTERMHSNYKKFLKGEWVPFDVHEGDKPKVYPKPVIPPEQTTPLAEDAYRRKVKEVEKALEITPRVAGTTPEVKKNSMGTMVDVNFYGMAVSTPHTPVTLEEELTSSQQIFNQWDALDRNETATKLVPALRATCDKLGLNDYFTYVFVRDYVNATQPTAGQMSRTVMICYLLSNMGYDVRLARNQNFIGYNLLPFAQNITVRPYLVFGDRQYYLFNCDSEMTKPDMLYTCAVTKGADTGKDFDLVVKELKLPENPHPFNVKFDDLSISGNVNLNVMQLLRDYPQMTMAGFAMSDAQPGLRKQIVESLKAQLDSLSQHQAVDKLLYFVQKGFRYEYDEVLHGREKTNFFEESLFYPACDCEDRSIFYSYLLWNVLGVKNQLLSYPGHEAVGVMLNEDISGTYYTDNLGEKYYISDPTNIGAPTGVPQTAFRDVAPVIDFTVPY